jgi:transcriptional regulator with XRE-family HTH domain
LYNYAVERLKELKLKKDVNNADIARALRKTPADIENLENGSAHPDIKTLSDLADYFDVTIDYLLEKTDNPSAAYDSLYFPTKLNVPEVLKKASLTVAGADKSLSQKDVDEIASYAESLKKRGKK